VRHLVRPARADGVRLGVRLRHASNRNGLRGGREPSSVRSGPRGASVREASRETLRGLATAKRRFREIFPGGFSDPTYLAWERGYKGTAHLAWERELGRSKFHALIQASNFAEIARRVTRFYGRSKLNMLALYEWMALREALASQRGARLLAPALFDLLHGPSPFGARLESFAAVLDHAPQRLTRLAKWPVATLFPFIAQPSRHLIVKPRLMKRAADRLGFEISYQTQPNARTYAAVIDAANRLKSALASWHPRDFIDVQGFLWVTSSDEYETWPWE
jgi:hypothetical protein